MIFFSQKPWDPSWDFEVGWLACFRKADAKAGNVGMLPFFVLWEKVSKALKKLVEISDSEESSSEEEDSDSEEENSDSEGEEASSNEQVIYISFLAKPF